MLSARSNLDRGTTLLEVLVTLGILAFGLLGLFGLENKIQLANIESYQRAQANLVLTDMVSRMNAAPAINAASVSCYSLSTDTALNACLAARVDGYASTTVFGTGDTTQPNPCPTAAGPARDQCEWSATLRGVAERSSSSGNVGAMSSARGCIARIQAPDPTPAVCTPGVYLVAVAWQGYNKTTAPSATCGAGLYGDETLRRVATARVVVGLPGCV
jgi:type IV pilus assembly protein PilV